MKAHMQVGDRVLVEPIGVNFGPRRTASRPNSTTMSRMFLSNRSEELFSDALCSKAKSFTSPMC
jgi:hypothetical protein